MSDNERVAVLEQRVKELEAHEDRQRNWKMRYLGWLISPSIALFVAGLTLWGKVEKQAFELERLNNVTIELQRQINKLYDIAADNYKKNE